MSKKNNRINIHTNKTQLPETDSTLLVATIQKDFR